MDVPIDRGAWKQVQICLFYIFCKQQLQGYQCIKEKKKHILGFNTITWFRYSIFQIKQKFLPRTVSSTFDGELEMWYIIL